MIIVYFMKPNGSWMYEVARFEDEEIYTLCWDALSKKAEKEGLTLTDSLLEGDENQYPLTWEEKEDLKEGLWNY